MMCLFIFCFLDMRSLVAAGLVFWYFFFLLSMSWNSAANDNHLWKMNYSLFIGICHINCNSSPTPDNVQNNDVHVLNSMYQVSLDSGFNWKEAFHNKKRGIWSFTSNRALYGYCRSVIWLCNLTCDTPYHCPKDGKDGLKLGPLLPHTVITFIYC
uniref:Uncharacterized protein n=1 Tax=Oryza glumipatula TaxID=40148 RepID=A0A0E0AI96_9ORYZ